MTSQLLNKENVSGLEFGEGDAGIVLKADGSIKVFNTHTNIDPRNLTETQLDQGNKIMALVLALSSPKILDMLIEMASDPTIVNQEKPINWGALS